MPALPRHLLLALAASGCSLLTTFPEEGQLCDTSAPVDRQCLPGFQCQAGLCRRTGDAGAGLDGGAGELDGGP